MSSHQHELKQTKTRSLETYRKRYKNSPEETIAKAALYTWPGPVCFVRMSSALSCVNWITSTDVSSSNPTAAHFRCRSLGVQSLTWVRPLLLSTQLGPLRGAHWAKSCPQQACWTEWKKGPNVVPCGVWVQSSIQRRPSHFTTTVLHPQLNWSVVFRQN